MNIKEPGFSGFENNSVSHSQPLQMVKEAKINKWLCCRNHIWGIVKKTWYKVKHVTLKLFKISSSS